MKEKKHMKIGDRLTYAYIRRIKRKMLCPCCQNGDMKIPKGTAEWICENCDYSLSVKEFEDGYVFWFCDECGSYLNAQEDFVYSNSKHICQNCNYENDITFDNIKGICIDCGEVIDNPDATLCYGCRELRKENAKKRAVTAAKVVGTAAAVAGLAYLAANGDGAETTDFSIDEDTDMDYPTCKTCGALMTQFDGWAWYTCPECGNAVRIIDGITTWQDEIFGRKKKMRDMSDFELADFCRGGELTED